MHNLYAWTRLQLKILILTQDEMFNHFLMCSYPAQGSLVN